MWILSIIKYVVFFLYVYLAIITRPYFSLTLTHSFTLSLPPSLVFMYTQTSESDEKVCLAPMSTRAEYNKEYMLLAAEEALKTFRSGAGTPFGAVLVNSSGVVAVGANTVFATKDPTCHAETNAIRAACAARGDTDLADCTMYASGEPCPMCRGAMALCGVPRCYYGTRYPEAASHGYSCERAVRSVVHDDQSVIEWNHVDGGDKVAELWAVVDAAKRDQAT